MNFMCEELCTRVVVTYPNGGVAGESERGAREVTRHRHVVLCGETTLSAKCRRVRVCAVRRVCVVHTWPGSRVSSPGKSHSSSARQSALSGRQFSVDSGMKLWQTQKNQLQATVCVCV